MAFAHDLHAAQRQFLRRLCGIDLRGIKVLRFLIMFKQCRQELHQLAHPRALLNIKVGNSVVSDRVVRSVWSFFFLYVLFTSFLSGRSI